jgi:DNA replication protein DnaC
MSAAAKPVQEAAIRQYAKQLRLPTVASQFSRLAEQALREKQSHVSYLEALLEAETEERNRKAMTRRIQEARFPAVKTIEEFDFQCAPQIPAMEIRALSEGGYLARKEPVIFLGDTGTGKTHLATGLAVAACRQRKRVRFATAAEMVTELIEAQNHAELTRVRNRWTRYELIVTSDGTGTTRFRCR